MIAGIILALALTREAPAQPVRTVARAAVSAPVRVIRTIRPARRVIGAVRGFARG